MTCLHLQPLSVPLILWRRGERKGKEKEEMRAEGERGEERRGEERRGEDRRMQMPQMSLYSQFIKLNEFNQVSVISPLSSVLLL